MTIEVCSCRSSSGPPLRGSGGVRKVRWAGSSRGKRGGVRVIYYWDKPRDRVFMLYAYRKQAQESLTPSQLKALRRIVKENLE